LAGPVVAAAVILDRSRRIRGLADSKALTAVQREELAMKIRERAMAWSIGRAEVSEIDSLNILQATLLAMARAVRDLQLVPTGVLVDGHVTPAVPYPVEAIIEGDATIPSISAASILAKVARDAEMVRWHEHYPLYGFDQHKGYSTALHLAALRQHGACPIHRRSFIPVQSCLQGVLALT
jgi:ribonuclease HII